VNAEIFLDSSYIIALSARSDGLHERAVGLASQLGSTEAHFVTTRAVLLEIGNALSKRRYRHAVIGLLHSFEVDPSVEIVPFELTPALDCTSHGLGRHRMGPVLSIDFGNGWEQIGCVRPGVIRSNLLQKSLDGGA